MFLRILLCIVLAFLVAQFGVNELHSQNVIKGKIIDAKSKDPLIGATVLIPETGEGESTDINGEFELPTRLETPVTIIINFMGFEEKTLEVKSFADPVRIELSEGGLVLETINVKGQRLSEERKKEPLSMETLDLLAIKETPSVSFYEGLGNLSGVDLTTASLGFTVINTRGFNSTSPVRSLQVIDGVDNQSPGLNFSLGNFLGSPELDILKVDLVQGAASAFYGPNAFNGVIDMRTKDPFMHKGLSAMVKVGERSLVETAIRWADDVKNSDGNAYFAYKFNFSYLTANDWEADNFNPVDGSEVPEANPGGFDAVNNYGDEYSPSVDFSGFSAWSNEAGLGTVFRTGYKERDLVDYRTENIKVNAVFSFRLKPEQKSESSVLELASNFGSGTTVYQGDNRFRLDNILFFQNRLEWKKPDKYFLRVYSTNEDAGDSYDPYATALRLQENAKSNEDWAQPYRQFWVSSNLGNIRGRMRDTGYPDIQFDPQTGEFTFDNAAANEWLTNFSDSLFRWHQLAENFANAEGGYFAPGTQEFDEEFQRLTTSKNNEEEEGTLFFDRSALYHAQGEYLWDIAWLDEFRTGFSSRLYRPNSDGTIFVDTAGTRISNFEYGFYTGFDKMFFDEELTLSASLRVDKNENFDFVYSPAMSLVWNPIPDNYFRFSLSSAVRNPTLSDQFLSLDVGPAILSGNLTGVDSLATLESFSDYRNTLNSDTLEYFNIDPIQPEQVQTFELGYRTILWNDVFVDAGYYYNFYRNFLGFNIGIDADIGEFGLPRDLQVFR
ncbi:MAG: TonB-dependent receptor plug domain-containing protein, partial [Bacteroidetes bacterium]|nr:TonB-dependent receptor plug domain-containing protein [Bacteroidota bacterium]